MRGVNLRLNLLARSSGIFCPGKFFFHSPESVSLVPYMVVLSNWSSKDLDGWRRFSWLRGFWQRGFWGEDGRRSLGVCTVIYLEVQGLSGRIQHYAIDFHPAKA